MLARQLEFGDEFLVGLPAVDAGHRDACHRLRAWSEAGAAHASGAVDALRAVWRDEEALMDGAGLASGAVERHRGEHAAQLARLEALAAQGAEVDRAAVGAAAAVFLVHVLTADRALARQLALVEAGQSPLAATEAEEARGRTREGAQEAALARLATALAARSVAPDARTLDERTRELTRLNAALEQERAELKVLLKRVDAAQGQLVHSEKMAAIGQLSAGVAHEINNPMAFVSANLGTLKSYVTGLLGVIAEYERHQGLLRPVEAGIEAARQAAELDHVRRDVGELLADTQEGVDRVSRIVKQLRDFSRDDGQWRDADLHASLETTLGVAWNLIKGHAAVERRFGQLPMVRCHPANLNQAVMHVLVNAVQAMPSFGTITVSTGAEREWVWLEFQDTGVGMTPEVQKRIFEPFFTTRPVGEGTGLGLSTVYDIVVHQHGGRIDVRSAPGKGSAFRLWLPAHGPRTEEAEYQSVPSPVPQEGARRARRGRN